MEIKCKSCFRYLIEIAKIYNVDYEPDPTVMKDDGRPIGNLKF